jgi:uncharacterized RDD family membrane protein YckC
MRKRLLASLVDSMIIAGAWFILVTSQRQIPVAFLTLSGGYLAFITFVYYFLQEGLFASTIGKSLLKLRVVGKTGDPCSFGASFKRNLLRFVDWLPVLYLIAGVTMLVSHERQRLGDMVAGTIVTVAPEKEMNPPPAPFLFH